MIDSDEKLTAFLPEVRAAEWLALDTEADSLHAYPEKLCLVQISLSGRDELIDPLATIDLLPLLDELRKHELILHGADYDLRLLRRTFGFVPGAIFDTMLAARLLGFIKFGLTDLVAQFLNSQLEKGPQKADWARRPLTDRMASYARNDTHYLKPLADLLRARLVEKGRLTWHQEVCARLVKDCAELRSPDLDQIWRLKGADRLDRRGLAVLRELWNWRDHEALAANKPPYFILNHETLVALAQAAVQTESIFSLLPPRIPPRRSEGLMSAVERGLALPSSQWPQFARSSGRRPGLEEKRRYEELRRKRDRHAVDLSLDPTLIASRATLSLLAGDWEKHKGELMNWQRELLQK